MSNGPKMAAAQPAWRAACARLAAWEWVAVALAAPVLLAAPSWAALALIPLALPVVGRLACSGRLSRDSALNGPVVVILLLGVMATAVSADRALSWPKLWGMVLQAAVFFAALNWLVTERRLRLAAALLVALPPAVAVFALLGTDWSLVRLLPLEELYAALPGLDWLARLPDNGLPSSTPLFHPRVVGGTLGMLLPLALAVLFFGQGWRWRLLAGVAALPALAVLVLTQAPMGFLGLAAALALFAVVWRRWLAAPLALAAGGLVAVLLASEPARLAVTLLDIQDRLGIAFVLRFDMWSRALAMIGDRPLTGVGLNGYPLILSHFYPGYLLGPEPHAHNLALQTAVDLGVPGLLVLLWLVVAFFALVARAARQSTAPWQRALLVGLAGALLAYVAGGLLDAITVGDKPLLLLWLLLGVAAAAGRLLPAAAAGDEGTDAGSRWWLVAGLVVLAVAVAGLALAPGVLAGNAGAVRGHRALVAARATGDLPAAEAAAAMRSLEQAVAQRPADPDLHSLLGSLAAWQGDTGAARAHLERRVELDGPQALDRYAPFTRWQRQLAGEPDPAPWASTAQLYSQWMNRYPGRAEETILLALVRVRQGEMPVADNLVQAAIERAAQPVGLLHWWRAKEQSVVP